MKVRRSVLAVFTVVAMTVAMVGVTSAPSSAATLTVTNCDDSGAGSLRHAVAAAASGDAIVFELFPACDFITLTSGDIGISQDVTITGPESSNLAISGNNASRVFSVTSGTTVTISGVRIQDGNPGAEENGGGIYNSGSLTVADSIITGNSGSDGGGIFNDGSLTVTNSTLASNGAYGGGGIFSFGSVTVSGSTLTGNGAVDGGGIDNNGGSLTVSGSYLTGNGALSGGAIVSYGGSVSLADSTVASNYADALGGGIQNTGSFTVSASTLTGNNASLDGGGIWNNGSLTVSAGTLTGNTADGAGNGIYNDGSVSVGGSVFAGDDCVGVITDAGYNLDEGHTCVTSTANGSKIDTPSGLNPVGLAYNGGPTQTIALLPGSAAIAMIPNPTAGMCPRVDQRGVANVSGQPCDAGAYQVGAAYVLSATSVVQPTTITPGTASSWYIDVENTGAASATGVQVEFSASGSGTLGPLSASSVSQGSGCVNVGVSEINCDIGTLDPGQIESAQVQIVSTAGAGTQIDGDAFIESVVGGGTDVNTPTVTVSVVAPAALPPGQASAVVQPGGTLTTPGKVTAANPIVVKFKLPKRVAAGTIASGALSPSRSKRQRFIDGASLVSYKQGPAQRRTLGRPRIGTVLGPAVPMSISRSSAEAGSFCGGSACSGDVTHLTSFSGYNDRKRPAKVTITWDASVRGRGIASVIYKRGDSATSSQTTLPACAKSSLGFTNTPCVFKKKVLGSGDVQFQLMLLSGDPKFGRR